MKKPYNYCTAGLTVIEIDPNGNYTRCVKYKAKKTFLGNVLTDNGFKLMDVRRDDFYCSLPCPERMCVSKNILRSRTKEELDHLIRERGVKGLYFNPKSEPEPSIFIRWHITNVCNFTCNYCTAARVVNQGMKEIGTDDVMKIGEKIVSTFDNISLRISGGEPSSNRAFVPLLLMFQENLSKFRKIEIRTNFSFREKQLEIFKRSWQRKLHYHISCHLTEKAFRPWEIAEVLSAKHDVSYVLKFIQNNNTGRYIDEFKAFFRQSGIPDQAVLVIADLKTLNSAPMEIPPALATLRSRTTRDTILVL